MQDQNTSEYICSLASRLNSTDSSPPSSAQLNETSQREGSLYTAGTGGIEAIASSQSETYAYYAKTAPRDDVNG